MEQGSVFIILTAKLKEKRRDRKTYSSSMCRLGRKTSGPCDESIPFVNSSLQFIFNKDMCQVYCLPQLDLHCAPCLSEPFSRTCRPAATLEKLS